MPYEFLKDIATADIAFKASGKTLEEMFMAAAEATMNVMVEDLNTIDPRQKRILFVEGGNPEQLLFQFLQEFIYYKDAEQLLLRIKEVKIEEEARWFFLKAEAAGELLDQHKHELNADVKAVTMHRFRVEKISGQWEAEVVLDI